MIEQISENLSGRVQVILQCKIKRKHCFEKLQSILGPLRCLLHCVIICMTIKHNPILILIS